MTAKRKIILSLSVSLDGCFEGPERQIDWHRVDDELHQHFNDELRTMGAFMEGRITHELMAGFWPTADADPSASAPVAEFARIWREMPKIVFSRTLRASDATEWNTVIKREVVAEEIEAFKALPGGDLALGGADLAATFRRHDLIDEYRLYVHPVMLGTGRPLFRPDDPAPASAGGPRELRLVETRTFGNGVVLLRHERVRASG
ncbi:dihydrofolate reductase family protein [Streptomyces sp. NBC_00083]|uniref:dihydrofolate reductase family protein n=1 Tax=Streptomyces sp. NBC_00083 TaxID=2975647 RepID=UPI0022562C11|nr:dihydrofolate reductase family protein [Streptomyces sp. NBC_00083]MCX5384265.1 dihydrofolate reductase family protein [Streptomyces sp. NBC_00083]